MNIIEVLKWPFQKEKTSYYIDANDNLYSIIYNDKEDKIILEKISFDENKNENEYRLIFKYDGKDIPTILGHEVGVHNILIYCEKEDINVFVKQLTNEELTSAIKYKQNEQMLKEFSDIKELEIE